MRFTFCCLALILSAALARGEDASVVARVNGEPITREELIEELLVRHGDAVLTELVRYKAVELEMKKRAVSVSKAEVDVEFERQRKIIENDPREKKSFKDKVQEEYNMSLDGYRFIVKRWVLIRKLFFSSQMPTDNEVRVWFYRNRERYDAPSFYTVQHIYISHEDPRTKQLRSGESVERRKRLIREALINGEDFTDVARRWSDDPQTKKDGGKLKKINSKTAHILLEPEFAEVMFRLKKGQATGPIKTKQGFHFLRVMDIEEGAKAEFDQFRARAKQDYLEEQAVTKRGLFLRKLMENTKVEKYFVPPKRKNSLLD